MLGIGAGAAALVKAESTPVETPSIADELEKIEPQIVSCRDMRVPLEIRPGGKFGYFDPEGGSLGRGVETFFQRDEMFYQRIK